MSKNGSKSDLAPLDALAIALLKREGSEPTKPHIAVMKDQIVDALLQRVLHGEQQEEPEEGWLKCWIRGVIIGAVLGLLGATAMFALV